MLAHVRISLLVCFTVGVYLVNVGLLGWSCVELTLESRNYGQKAVKRDIKSAGTKGSKIQRFIFWSFSLTGFLEL